MTDHAHELRRYSRKIGHPAGDVPSVMLAAAEEIECLRSENAGLVDDMNLLRDNNTALRARIKAMEKQEPFAYLPLSSARILESGVIANGVVWNCCDKAASDIPLYASPCAQPAPSVPEGWKLVPNVPEGFSREDLEAVADGLDGYEKTVNVGNVTGEGDDHLESTTAYAARFIRAMLAATEAKP